MQTAPRGGAERAARPDSFLWGAGHGGAVRPQAERGSPGDGDNGFHLKGRPEPQQRTAGGPAPGQVSGGCGLGPGRGGLGGREEGVGAEGGRRGRVGRGARGRRAAGKGWRRRGPGDCGRGAAGGGGGRSEKAGRRPDFLSASRSSRGRKAFPARF